MKTFTVTFDLTAGEEKALLQRYSSLDKMIGDFVAREKDQAMRTLVRLYANGEKTAILNITEKEQIEQLDGRLIRDVEGMPKEAMEIIVNKISDNSEVVVEEQIK
ncbi:MAG: hypothetical protein ACOWWR_18555 [Eubacteriales bacterium]